MEKEQYKQLEQNVTPKPPILKNVVKAFFIGGLICTIGQAVSLFYIIFFNFTEATAGNPTVATMVFLP